VENSEKKEAVNTSKEVTPSVKIHNTKNVLNS
jgi:hypothetical protein